LNSDLLDVTIRHARDILRRLFSSLKNFENLRATGAPLQFRHNAVKKIWARRIY